MAKLPEVFESKTPKVYKDKKLNSADFGDFNLTNYQVFLLLVSKIGGIDEVGKYLQPAQIEREYILTAKEFSSAFNIDIRSSYNYLKKSVDKLIKTDIKIETSDKITRINICSKAEYNKHKGTITIKFTDDIMPYLSQVQKQFVLYNIKEISNFRSLYTTRLYELIQGYKETGWVLMSIDQLRYSLSTGKSFKLYADFKKYTFGRACKEINDIYGLDLQFEEIKEGRKVVAIKFTFSKTRIHKAINPKTGQPVNIYEKPKPKATIKKQDKSKDLTTAKTFEGQLAFDDLPESTKNFGSIFKDLATHLEKSKK